MPEKLLVLLQYPINLLWAPFMMASVAIVIGLLCVGGEEFLDATPRERKAVFALFVIVALAYVAGRMRLP